MDCVQILVTMNKLLLTLEHTRMHLGWVYLKEELLCNFSLVDDNNLYSKAVVSIDTFTSSVFVFQMFHVLAST